MHTERVRRGRASRIRVITGSARGRARAFIVNKLESFPAYLCEAALVRYSSLF